MVVQAGRLFPQKLAFEEEERHQRTNRMANGSFPPINSILVCPSTQFLSPAFAPFSSSCSVSPSISPLISRLPLLAMLSSFSSLAPGRKPFLPSLTFPSPSPSLPSFHPFPDDQLLLLTCC